VRNSVVLTLVGCPFLLFGAATTAQEPDFKPIPSDKAVMIAKAIVTNLEEITDQLARAPLAIVPEADKAYALHHAKSGGGIIVVPVKGFDLDDKAAKGEEGIPLGYLFGCAPPNIEVSSYRLLTASGKPAAVRKRLFLSYPFLGGEPREGEVFRFRLKKDGEGPGKLLIYAMDKEPALAIPLRKQASNSGAPISISVKDLSERRLTIVVSLQDQYAANIVIGRE
jgi:hypothetical protein